MTPLHSLQFLIFSACVHIFSLFCYFVYYADMLHFSGTIESEYDYIIVGSGTAGSLIGHRLATETNYSFIILEAGGRSHKLLDIPVLGPFLHGSIFDWQFESVQQDNACLAMKDRKCRLPQGKILGGSSKLNNMIHVRGNISHYLDWFNGKFTEEYILKQFDFIERDILHLNDVKYQSNLANAALEAAKELGYKIINEDFNFKQGFMKSRVHQKNGQRWTTSDNLLHKHVIVKALVEKLEMNGNTAQAVKVDISGKKHRIVAQKGIILSAGAINTPKILQLSGIGPKNILESLKIPVIKVLPVGKNLQDHVATGLDLVLFNQTVSVKAFDMLNPLSISQYFFKGEGPLTTPGCEALGFISTKNETFPDLQYMVLPVGLSSDRGSHFGTTVGINDITWNNYFAKSFDEFASTFLLVVLHPHSKGEVFITSVDPYHPPTFDPKYLSDYRDKDVLISGLKILKELLNTNSLKNIGGHLNPLHFPGCERHNMFSDEYLDCYVRHLTLTTYHPVGTCSMGLSTSEKTVVDTSFRVLGFDNLFIADASVLPTLPSGNINAAVAMIASVFFDENIVVKSKAFLVSQFSRKHTLYESLLKVCIAR